MAAGVQRRGAPAWLDAPVAGGMPAQRHPGVVGAGGSPRASDRSNGAGTGRLAVPAAEHPAPATVGRFGSFRSWRDRARIRVGVLPGWRSVPHARPGLESWWPVPGAGASLAAASKELAYVGPGRGGVASTCPPSSGSTWPPSKAQKTGKDPGSRPPGRSPWRASPARVVRRTGRMMPPYTGR
jgi:hypothetical protein